jgi:hypothetical protein
LNEKGKSVSEDASVQRLSTIQIVLFKNKLFLLSDFKIKMKSESDKLDLLSNQRDENSVVAH